MPGVGRSLRSGPINRAYGRDDIIEKRDDIIEKRGGMIEYRGDMIEYRYSRESGVESLKRGPL
jgi:hypothetical protein